MEFTNLQLALAWLYLGWTGVNLVVASNRGNNDWMPILISLALTPLVGSIYVLGTPIKSE